jgi:chromate transporter
LSDLDLDPGPPPLTLREALPVWLRVGLLSFGGPAGQIAVMHRLLVEERRWVSESRFLHALNYCMLLPGPEAQQLAAYLGWLLHGVRGGLVAGVLFVLPGALVMLALAAAYASFTHLPSVAALFFGLKCAVLAVVVEAVLRLGRRALASRWHWGLAAAAFVALALFAVPFPWVVAGSALAGYLAHRGGLRFESAGHGSVGGAASEPGPVAAWVDARAAALTPRWPRTLTIAAVAAALWWLPTLALWAALGRDNVWVASSLFFGKTALVTFGGAYAVLAYVAQRAVETYGWLSAGEMLDGLGLAETTPGPLILVLQFVGFLAAFREPGALSPLLAGSLGALLTLWVVFAPSFLWIFVGAPYVEALRGRRALTAALSAVTAAVVGVVLSLAVWFALHVLFAEVRSVQSGPFHLDLPVLASFDPLAAGIAALAALALFRFKLGMVWVLGLAALAGWAAGLAFP